jgi:hypothetical protein
MPVPPEVDSLERKVSRNQRVGFPTSTPTSAGQKPQHGAVVSNSSLNGLMPGQLRQAANFGYQRFFGNRHDNHYKRRPSRNAARRLRDSAGDLTGLEDLCHHASR